MITVRRQRVKDARDLGRDDRQWANDERVRRKDWRNLAEVIRALGGQSGNRTQKQRDAAEVAIYTPASSAGRQMSVFKSFHAPTAIVRNDAEAFRDKTLSAVSDLLAGLKSRVFLMNNVQKDKPTVFRSRRALSDLCSPVSLQQIEVLMARLDKSNQDASGTIATVATSPHFAAASAEMANQRIRPILRPQGSRNSSFRDTRISRALSTDQYCWARRVCLLFMSRKALTSGILWR